MKDQNQIDNTSETPLDKKLRAIDLFIESVLKPDDKLRLCAYNQMCYDELMQVREHVLSILKDLRNQDIDKSI